MYLKSKWKNISVKKKIFIWSTSITILSLSFLYICMYLFMPRVYEVYKVNKIQSSIDNLKIELSEDSDLNLNDVLDEFAYDNNLDIILVSKDNNNFITNIIYSSFREGMKNPNKIPFLDNHVPLMNKNLLDKEKKEEGYKGVTSAEEYVYKLTNQKESLTMDEEVYVKSLDNVYNMIVHIAVSPINEASTSLQLFIPFAIVAIIIIAIIISLFYAILISKPLIKINTVAKKMAELDFNNIIEIKGEDEIGQLSSSLNLMNKNLKEAFDELEKINSKLTKEIEMERKLERERREFIATISHELKSPITIISGQLEGMIYNIGKYKDRDKYLKETYGVTEKMKELVQEILHLSERENGQFKYNFTTINFSNMVKSTISELKYFVDNKNLNLQVDILENIYINADEKLIKKVITNIIKNAVTYSPNEENIIVKLSENELVVENTGVTIPNDEVNEIFNAFYRVDKSRNRKTGGTGLGLYIVKTILDKHENINYFIEAKENSVIFKMNF